MLKKIDIYIIRKYLATFLLSIAMILTIAVIFDFTEKLDNFIESKAPTKAIIFDYYFNFIPYFANLFSPLFAFISVIFFTSKLAYNTEIIAILAGGVSLKRILRPYFIAATIIATGSLLLSNFIIPPSNKTRLAFENQYVRNKTITNDNNIHFEVSPNVYIYISYFNTNSQVGQKTILERYENNKLVSVLTARSIEFVDSTKRWKLKNCFVRDIEADREIIKTVAEIDTTLAIYKEDFKYVEKLYETMNSIELDQYIKKQEARGVGNIEEFKVELYRRYSSPISVFILTLIGVALSSRKVRGGTGLHIGFGLALSFSYILFSQIANTFAINGSMNMFLAVWIPNIMFAIIAVVLYRNAPK